MTPLNYLQNYSFPSQSRLLLYNHVFNLCKETTEDEQEEDNERILLGKVNLTRSFTYVYTYIINFIIFFFF